MLPQIRYLTTFRVESSTISADSNITDNIIRKVISVQYEKCRTKNQSFFVLGEVPHLQPEISAWRGGGVGGGGITIILVKKDFVK